MNSQVFNSKRFSAVLHRDVRMQCSTWLWRIAVMIGVMTVFSLFGDWFIHNVELSRNESDTTLIYNTELTMLSFVCLFSFSLFTSLGASHFMQDYATKGERINQLMSPGSTLEKFTSRFLISVVGIILVLIVGWYFAEFVRVAVGKAIYHLPTRGITGFFTALYGIDSHNIIGYPTNMLISSIICVQALYVMGSAFFLKNAFLKTWAAACVIEFVFGFACGFLASFLLKHRIACDATITIEGITAIAIGFFAVTTVFAYVITYFRMREQEIIQRM